MPLTANPIVLVLFQEVNYNKLQDLGDAMLIRVTKTAALLAFAASMNLVTAAAQEPTPLERFLDQYRCPVIDRLERIYAVGDPDKHRDEYLIIDIPTQSETYVQCIFHASHKLYCEAASGYFLDAPGQPRTRRLPARAIDALGRLGFSTDDSKGNFNVDLDIGEPPDFKSLADLMLKALHDAYGAEAETKLRFHAPYARRATRKCVPVS